MPEWIVVDKMWVGADDSDEDDPANWADKRIPAKYIVCPRCGGKGTHTNPNIDGNGLTQSDLDEAGPEFLEDYMSGVYDITCVKCQGMRVVLVPDDELAKQMGLTTELNDYYQYEQDKEDELRMREMESRYQF